MSNVFRFVTVGDLHLDKSRLHDLFGPSVTALQFAEVEKVYAYAERHSIENVVWLGDIGDTETLSDASELALLEFLFRYDGRFNTYIILGNHDKEQKHVHSLCKIDFLYRQGVFKTTRVFTDHTVETIDGVQVEFMPFPYFTPERTDSVCFAHIDRPGATMDSGIKVKAGHGHPEPDGDNLWVCGHLHTPHTVGRTWFSGTLFQTYYGEQVEKSFLDVRARYKRGRLEYKITVIDHRADFQLLTLTPDRFEDVKIDKNPLFKYRIFHAEDVEFPSNFMLHNPNVVEIKPFKTKRELREMLVPERVNYSITDGLPDFLKKRGHSERDVKRGARFVRRASRNHGIPI